MYTCFEFYKGHRKLKFFKELSIRSFIGFPRLGIKDTKAKKWTSGPQWVWIISKVPVWVQRDCISWKTSLTSETILWWKGDCFTVDFTVFWWVVHRNSVFSTDYQRFVGPDSQICNYVWVSITLKEKNKEKSIIPAT